MPYAHLFKRKVDTRPNLSKTDWTFRRPVRVSEAGSAFLKPRETTVWRWLQDGGFAFTTAERLGRVETVRQNREMGIATASATFSATASPGAGSAHSSDAARKRKRHVLDSANAGGDLRLYMPIKPPNLLSLGNGQGHVPLHQQIRKQLILAIAKDVAARDADYLARCQSLIGEKPVVLVPPAPIIALAPLNAESNASKVDAENARLAALETPPSAIGSMASRTATAANIIIAPMSSVSATARDCLARYRKVGVIYDNPTGLIGTGCWSERFHFGDNYSLFFDVDITSKTGFLTPEQVDALVITIQQRAVRVCYDDGKSVDDPNCEMMMSMAAPTLVMENNEELYKTSIRLCFIRVCVNHPRLEIHLQLAIHEVRLLHKGNNFPYGSTKGIEKIIDCSIIDNGSRFNFQHKSESCPVSSCSTQKSQRKSSSSGRGGGGGDSRGSLTSCKVCGGHGKIDIGREMRAVKYYDSYGISRDEIVTSLPGQFPVMTKSLSSDVRHIPVMEIGLTSLYPLEAYGRPHVLRSDWNPPLAQLEYKTMDYSHVDKSVPGHAVLLYHDKGMAELDAHADARDCRSAAEIAHMMTHQPEYFLARAKRHKHTAIKVLKAEAAERELLLLSSSRDETNGKGSDLAGDLTNSTNTANTANTANSANDDGSTAGKITLLSPAVPTELPATVATALPITLSTAASVILANNVISRLTNNRISSGTVQKLDGACRMNHAGGTSRTSRTNRTNRTKTAAPSTWAVVPSSHSRMKHAIRLMNEMYQARVSQGLPSGPKPIVVEVRESPDRKAISITKENKWCTHKGGEHKNAPVSYLLSVRDQNVWQQCLSTNKYGGSSLNCQELSKSMYRKHTTPYYVMRHEMWLEIFQDIVIANALQLKDKSMFIKSQRSEAKRLADQKRRDLEADSTPGARLSMLGTDYIIKAKERERLYKAKVANPVASSVGTSGGDAKREVTTDTTTVKGDEPVITRQFATNIIVDGSGAAVSPSISRLSRLRRSSSFDGSPACSPRLIKLPEMMLPRPGTPLAALHQLTSPALAATHAATLAIEAAVSALGQGSPPVATTHVIDQSNNDGDRQPHLASRSISSEEIQSRGFFGHVTMVRRV